MNTENETWRDASSEKEGTDAGRDGNQFDGTYNVGRPSYKRENGEHSDRPHRPRFTTGNGDRPQRAYSSDRPYRPRFNPNAEGGERSERPQRPYNPSYGNRPQRPYNPSYGNDRPYRPRFNPNAEGGERSERPQRPYNPSHGNDRPYRPRFNPNAEGGERGERPQRPYNPSYGNDRPYRPRFNPNAEGGERGERPQRPYNAGGNRPQQQQRPRFNPYNAGGGKPGYGNRPNNGNRRTGDYNPHAKYSKKKQIEYKERFVDPNEPIRLNKFLANAGICSRREADEFITAGVVSVNGTVVTELGTKIKRSDEVKFHEKPVSIERKIYILLNKPKDTVTTSDDPQERRTVLDLVKGACSERIYPVGRLDLNTTGVLLLTNDGDLASKLTHPKYLKKKIYHVRLDKNLTKADMEQIAAGIQLDDGEIHADAISYPNEEKKNEVGIEIHSGRNRIVRRIFESLGYRVVRLDRVFFAGLTKKGLRRGEWRFLTEKEVNLLLMGAFE